MRLSHKAFPIFLTMALGVVITITTGAGPAKEPGKGATPKEPSAPGVVQTKKAGTEKLDLPVPKGQPQKGLKIPLYGLDGKLMMNFQIGVATWIDEENIKMGELHVETFKADGEKELDLDLPDSILNTKTKDITSKARVNIKRDDFEISGNTMVFNTETKRGTLGGGVRMLIYNLDSKSGEKPAGLGGMKIDLKPITEEKK